MTPMPTQLSGAEFLASRRRALLADEPRVGKTGAAILAADLRNFRKIDVVTTASGRAVWRRAFLAWSKVVRSIGVVGEEKGSTIQDIRIMSWAATRNTSRRVDTQLVICDEDHYGKNPDAACSRAVFGRAVMDGERLLNEMAIVNDNVWCWHLTGTPLPHDPGDTWMRLRASAPERLMRNASKGWPDVTRYGDFRTRYCIVKMKKISNWNRIPVVIGGRNENELRARMEGFMLRRTQKDIGVQPPRYETFPLIVSAAQRKEAFADVSQRLVLEAAEAGETKELEMLLGPLRRNTGLIKARAVVEAVKEEFACGLDKIVLMYWHESVGRLLEKELESFGAVRLGGSTVSKDREEALRLFRESADCKVFLGQIQAAGEAIDLSAASLLWFVETSHTPKDMAQAALRIVNVQQTRTPIVKVCCLAGTIDEPMQAALLRLWTSINKTLQGEK